MAVEEVDRTWRPTLRNNPLTFWDDGPCPKYPTTRCLGAEIEVGNRTTRAVAGKLDSAIDKWKAHVHGDCAFELCTAPASGSQWVAQVEEFCMLFKEGAIGVTPSCGCHVHVDARDLDVPAVERLIHLLIHLEPLLFSMVPIARRTNTFCTPAAPLLRAWLTRRHLLTAEPWLLECIYGRDTDARILYTAPGALARLKKDKLKHRGQITRFLAFNFMPYFGHGTIECRLLDGCVNPVRLINWGVMLASLFDYARDCHVKDVHDLIKQPRLKVLLSISPSLAHKRWIVQTLKAFSPLVEPSTATPEYIHARRAGQRSARIYKARVAAGVGV